MSKKIIIFSAITICVVVVLILVYYAAGKATLYVTSSPTEITFIFNDKAYTTPAKIPPTRPGKYTIYNHTAGYKEYKQDISLHLFERKKFEIKLEELPLEEAILDVENESIESDKNESSKVEEKLTKIKTEDPLTNYLPYFGPNNDFWFDYYSDNGRITYFLRSTDYKRDLPKIQEWIKNKGIDNTKILIVKSY